MTDQSVSHAMDNSGVKIPPPLIYVGLFLVGIVLQWLFPLPALPAFVGRTAGVLCIAIGAGLCLWSIGIFRRAATSLMPTKPSTALVIVGPYRLMRNPMYLGLLMVYLGVALMLQVTWALVLTPVVVGVVQRQVIVREERYLAAIFGEEYRAYKSRVRRWV